MFRSLKAYPSIRALPKVPDLVVVAVPANAVDAVIDDCASRGVRAAIVISAGFAEVGAEGRKRQQELLGKIRDYGMRMVGPNCLGLLNTDPGIRLNASFAPDFPPAGKVASQSRDFAGSCKPARAQLPFQFCQRRQQSGYFRQRSPLILGEEPLWSFSFTESFEKRRFARSLHISRLNSCVRPGPT
jgi:hypothetical protein